MGIKIPSGRAVETTYECVQCVVVNLLIWVELLRLLSPRCHKIRCDLKNTQRYVIWLLLAVMFGLYLASNYAYFAFLFAQVVFFTSEKCCTAN